jgi:hypothetical protein
VVGAARSLRTEAKSFLTWLYDDFARYLGKQKSLDLAEALAQEDGEELADRVRGVVDKLISGWRPKTERLDRFSSRSRSILGASSIARWASSSGVSPSLRPSSTPSTRRRRMARCAWGRIGLQRARHHA